MTFISYITTTIPYVNARPHIGFALELVQADALARYHRLLGADVRLQTGTDDNALSNVLAARQRGIPVEELVEDNAAAFKDLCRSLDVSAEVFVRTSDPEHHQAASHFLSVLDPNDVYEASYHGLYCPRCEDFYLERDVQRSRCPEHETKLDEVAERNYFFRLSRYQEQLRELIVSRGIDVCPRVREEEILKFIDRGLTDFSISRSAARAGGWGVPFPGDASQVVYVWVDALVNYVSGLGYPDWGNGGHFWTRATTKTHVIGKNVWKFHAVYWPALLLSAELPLPDRILVHGFLTADGQKISKSTGHAPDPTQYIERFGADALRYYLLGHARPFEDTDFTESRLEEVYTTHLANDLGNLCSRLAALAESANVGGVSTNTSPDPPTGYHDQFAVFRFDHVISCLWKEVTRLNQEIATAQPWSTIRAGPSRTLDEQLRDWLGRLYGIAYWLTPLLPRTAASIIDTLTQKRVHKCSPLFPKRDPVRHSA